MLIIEVVPVGVAKLALAEVAGYDGIVGMLLL